jgi:hypothetical protein
MKQLWLVCLTFLTCALFPFVAHAAAPPKNVKVCVRIEEKSWSKDGSRAPAAPEVRAEAPKNAAPPRASSPEAPPNTTPIDVLPPNPGDVALNQTPGPDAARAPSAEPRAPEGMADPEEADFTAIDPLRYLQRLIEYQVTHEPGFESVANGCTQTVLVELYPVLHGWTAFARYSGNEREEKVDVVRLDELGIFAERVTTALLRDKTISETLTRTTVLRADSDRRTRRIETHTHLLLGMGSGVRFGSLPTAPNATAPAVDSLRVDTPLEFVIGARNKFRGWALDATGKLDVGLTERAARLSAGGGQVDYSVGLGAGLNFLAYADPDAVNTLYYGAGGSFELSRYQTQGAKDSTGYQPAPSGVWGGGLDVNLVLGYEFMRTSTLHFFVQGTVSLPAYVFDAQNDQSVIHSYIPSAYAVLGLLL